MSHGVAIALFVVGYPAAIVVIARWVPVVRQRRVRWFVVHEAAVGAIVAGHALLGNTSGVLVNGAWLVVATGWYALAPRLRTSRRRRT